MNEKKKEYKQEDKSEEKDLKEEKKDKEKVFSQPEKRKSNMPNFGLIWKVSKFVIQWDFFSKNKMHLFPLFFS